MRRASLAVAAVVPAIASACGGSNVEAPAVDLSGSWSLQETATGNCPGVSYPQVRSYTATLTQNGNRLAGSITPAGANWSGSVAGTHVTWSQSRADSGGTIAVDFSGTAAADGNGISGTATWTWTGSGVSCGGSGTVSGTRTAVMTPFGAPTDVAASAGNSQVTITWNRVVGGARYRIYRSTSPDVSPATGTPVVTVIPGTNPNWTDGWLVNETTYYYVVTALDSAGTESAPSSVASAAPSSALPRPATPSILSATPGSKTVTIAHDLVAGATTYVVYYSTNASDLASYATLPRHGWVSTTGTGAFGPPNLTPGTTYWFAVTARNLDGESEPSAPVSAVPNP
jgi:hypothetical protein